MIGQSLWPFSAVLDSGRFVNYTGYMLHNEGFLISTQEVGTIMELICGYMRDDQKRHALNALAQKTFGIEFEDWVRDGYFEGDYIPYSLIENGELLSNISANRMQFVQNGAERTYIQLGTVMTEAAHRQRGLARRLMERVLSDWEGRCDGIYLFANLNALDFYRKMGFQEGVCEYCYELRPDSGISGREIFRPIDESLRAQYMDCVRNGAVNAALEQVNRFGLQMFYTADLSSVRYAEDIDCFAVIAEDDEALTVQSVVSRSVVPLRAVLERIDAAGRPIRLGFAPRREDATLFDAQRYDGADDYRLFYRGALIEEIERERLRFPVLSHA